MDDSEEFVDLVDLDEDAELDEEEEFRTKTQVFRLNDRLTALADGSCGRVEDAELSQGMSQAVKPYADRLVALKRLLHPIDRLIEKRRQAADLQSGIAGEVDQIEAASGAAEEFVEPALLKDLQAELAVIKKDRKLSQIEEEEEEEEEPRGDQALIDLPIAERLRRIFGARFIDGQRLGQLLGMKFDEEELARFDQTLIRIWGLLFDGPQLKPHVEGNRLKTLQNAFRDYALVLRAPLLPGPGPRERQPCNLEFLRHRFSDFFLKVSARALWYIHLDFYRAPLAKAHWALVDRQYLNCTFKKPGIRLLMYARANELPPAIVHQKSALEDAYDRVVLSLALGEPFFANCNSITCTSYQLPGADAWKRAYLYYKDDYICISGKRGVPHWRPARPRWPGVLPSIVFAVS